jgi:hypothetical protein
LAAYLTNVHLGNTPHTLTFADLWTHYERSHFLYSAKLEMLRPHLPQIEQLWSGLLNASAGIFQIHYSLADGAVASSVSAFRDTPECYVIQHASSVTHPELLIECLLSLTTGISATSAKHVCMFYRPENKWPARLQKVVGGRLAGHLHQTVSFDYLVCEPQRRAESREVQPLHGTLPEEAMGLMKRAWGDLRVNSLGFEKGQAALGHVEGLYETHGCTRARHVLGFYRNNVLAGMACVYLGSFPLNLSFLCNRVELAVPPDAPDREDVIYALLRAAENLFAELGCPLCTALTQREDTVAALRSGFRSGGRSYNQFLWSCEQERGFASTAIACSSWYSSIARMKGRRAAGVAKQNSHLHESQPPA